MAVKVAINGFGRIGRLAFSNTTLTKELEFIQKTYGITDEEIHLDRKSVV